MYINKKASTFFVEASYPGTELNRHSHYCEQDFKSCVSTSSTTRVNTLVKNFALLRIPILHRDVSTSSTTRVNTLVKNFALLRIPILIGTCLLVPPPGKHISFLRLLKKKADNKGYLL